VDLFYLLPDQVDPVNAKATVTGEEFHHLARVLRCQPGNVVPITDGAGFTAELLVESIGKHSLEGAIRNPRMEPPPETQVTVALSLLKLPQRFDFFLEKATELGVARIVPMITKRTVSTPDSGKIERKLERWRGIVHSAARQSRRYHLPRLSVPLAFSEALALGGYDLRLIAHESEERFPAFEPAGKKILFLVGGEGGFTDAEVANAADAGFTPLSFGASVLRAETAGIFAVALIRSMLLAEADPAKRL
jgi:16S rRNA (uracil1498-N3)-methyltransferase